jgi:flagellar motor switch protein FliN/FliY
MLNGVASRGLTPAMAAVEQVDIELTFEVGGAEMPLSAALALGRGTVISLGRDASKPISILANGRKIANGKVRLQGDRIAIEVAPPAPKSGT